MECVFTRCGGVPRSSLACVCVLILFGLFVQVDKGEFEQKDKHWGKGLSPQEFCVGLERFFHNGR